MISKRCKVGELRAAFISDIHTGHSRVPTESICDGLFKAFPDNAETAELDIIFIAGDFFDRNLHLGHDGVLYIQRFVSHLLKVAEKYNIVVRLLEGTPSHDMKQAVLFTNIFELVNSKADFKWVENLSIEHIESLGIDVLYVPDEWEHDPNETWKQVKQLLSDHGLEKVHFSIMHGCFEFQLPSHIGAVTHSSERYLSITSHYIDIGHHHTPREYRSKKHDCVILINGSFDRLCHGEEEAKGHYRLNIHPDKADEVIFVENPLATKFITINCLDMELDVAMRRIDEMTSPLPENSHVRVLARPGSEIATCKKDIEGMWPDHKWTVVREALETAMNQQRVELVVKHEAVHIDETSVMRLMERKLGEDYNPERKEAMFKLLEAVL